MKKLLLSLFVLGFILGLSACTSSSNVFDFILDESYDGFVTMATSADYAPYEWIVEDENGKSTVQGVDIEIAKAIAHALEKNLRVIHKGFDFLIEDVRSGKVDFIIAGLTPTPSRAEIIDFSKSYYTEESVTQVVLIHQDNVNLYPNVDSLNQAGKRVGAQTGSIQVEFAELFTPLATHKVVADINELMNNLTNKQIDALYTEGPVAQTRINDGAPFVQLILEGVDSYQGNAVGVKKGNSELLQVINTVIDDLIEQGKIAEWLELYSA
ncbi:MAG TPA: transporter substrate-binding domain-containing protein [Acholeplasmataceae bacterium]|nr:transporter substrate-binding domain-containing protein [Acholeplasmataceae bacterium]